MRVAAPGIHGRRLLPMYDQALLFVIAMIAAMGLVMVFSATITTAELSRQTQFDSLFYFKRHLIYSCDYTHHPIRYRIISFRFFVVCLKVLSVDIM